MTRTTLRGSYRAKQRRTQHQSLWKKLNKERQFSKIQGYAFAFLVLTICGGIGGVALAQGPLFHSIESLPNPNPNLHDPYTILWQELLSNGIQGYSTNNTLALGGGDPKFRLIPTATFPAIAVSKESIDFSTIAGKNFGISFAFINTTNTISWSIKLFLTTNKTISTSPNYDPYNDNQVALIIQAGVDTGQSNFNWKLFMQTELNTKISATDQTTCSASNTNSCFASGTEQNGRPGSGFYGSAINFGLNFTGANGGSNGGSYFNPEGIGGGVTLITANFLPAFKFQAIPYYVGLWAAPTSQEVDIPTAAKTNFCITAQPVSNTLIPCLTFSILIPSPPVTITTVQPSIDTGGFFGPIIRALIQIGVFIVSNLISFFSYLYALIVPILAGLASIIGVFLETIINAFGAIFGDNSLGTQVHTAFSQILNYLTQIFASAVAIWGNIITTLLRFLTFITGFFGSNPFVTFIENFLAQAPNFWTVLNGVWADIMQYYISGVFTIQTILVFWYLFGIYEVFITTTEGNGLKGFKEWLDISELGFFGIFKAGYWLIDEAYGFIVQLKQLIFGNTVSPVKVAGTG